VNSKNIQINHINILRVSARHTEKVSNISNFRYETFTYY